MLEIQVLKGSLMLYKTEDDYNLKLKGDENH